MTNLVIYSLQASAILLSALAICRLAPSRSAAWRSAILSVAVFAAAAVPLFDSAAARLGLSFEFAPAFSAAFRQPVPTEQTPGPTQLPRSTSLAVEKSPAVTTPVEMPLTPPAPNFVPGSTRRVPLSMPSVLWLWTVGAALGLLRIVIGLAQLRRVERNSDPVIDGPLSSLAAEIGTRYGLNRSVTILVRRDAAPVTWGFLRPRLLLPSQAVDWPEERGRMVIAHELAHVRRADWSLHLFAEIQRAVFWFNPVWWVAVRRLVEESELAADDLALTSGLQGVDNADYAEELLALARTYASPRPAPVALAMARPSTLERRFNALVDLEARREAVTPRVIVLMIAAFGATALGLTACHPARTSSNPPLTPPRPAVIAQANPLPATPVPAETSQTPTRITIVGEQGQTFSDLMKPCGQTGIPGVPPGNYEVHFSGGPESDPPIACVGNEVIRKSDLERYERQQRAAYPNEQRQIDRHFKDLLRNLIDIRLLLQVAKDLRLDVENKIDDRLREIQVKNHISDLVELERQMQLQGVNLVSLKDDWRRDLLTQEVMAHEVASKITITLEEARAYYDTHDSDIYDFRWSSGIKLGEIGFSKKNMPEGRSRAEAALRELKAGADFGEVARKYSDLPSAERGGLVGFIDAADFNTLAPPMRDALSSLHEPGAISDIIETADGVMILTALDLHTGGKPSFAMAESTIRAIILTQRLQPAVRAYLNRLRTERGVQVVDGYIDTGAAKK